MASTRRLTAILAADVAGYSRLMGADEEGTHERLQAHLREYPATSAARIAVRRRVEAMAETGPLVEDRAL